MSATSLVTGAGGFVGANLVRHLLAAGDSVIACVRPDAEPWRLAELGDDVGVVALDLRDQAAVEAAIGRIRPRRVFHLAAHGAYSWQTDAREIFETNVLGTAALVQACGSAGCEVLVHAGSSSEYGYKNHPPREDEPLAPNSAYAVAKAAATLYCAHVGRAGALRTVTLRLYSAYGPLEEPGRLMPTLVARGLRGELPPLVAPGTARDFVYVDDVCGAFVAAAQEAAAGSIYNVGSGTQTTIREVVELARAVLAIEAAPEWQSAPARPWDTATWVSDPALIEKELGWRATMPLSDGFSGMVEWMRAEPRAVELYDRMLRD